LHGAAVNAENNTSMPPAFLMQQMEWRETLDDCKALKNLETKITALEALLEEVDASHAQALAQAAHLMDVDHNYAAAVGQVRALMFIEKFAHEVQLGLDACT
jgi:molecular chaperone HscB